MSDADPPTDDGADASGGADEAPTDTAERAVFFDLDDTLVTYDRPFDVTFEAALDAHTDEYRPAMFETYQNAFFTYFEGLTPDPYREAIEDVVTRFDLDVDPAAVTETYVDEEVDATVVDAATREVVRRIGERQSVGVISNGVRAVQERKLRHHGLLTAFDAVVVSYDVGAHKPDPEVFAAAKDALPAESYVFVGDLIDEDVVPANDAGFATVYVRGDADAPDAEVGSLAALRDLLDLV